jgi:hypothetical protein
MLRRSKAGHCSTDSSSGAVVFMHDTGTAQLNGNRNKPTSEYRPHSDLPLGCGHTVLCTLTRTQLGAEASCQMNQLLGANIDTTLRPILTVHVDGTGPAFALSLQRI